MACVIFVALSSFFAPVFCPGGFMSTAFAADPLAPLEERIAKLADQANNLYSHGDLEGAMTLYKEGEQQSRELGDEAWVAYTSICSNHLSEMSFCFSYTSIYSRAPAAVGGLKAEQPRYIRAFLLFCFTGQVPVCGERPRASCS